MECLHKLYNGLAILLSYPAVGGGGRMHIFLPVIVHANRGEGGWPLSSFIYSELLKFCVLRQYNAQYFCDVRFKENPDLQKL